MTVFDSDPSFGGPSFEEMNLYNEVVLHAGELAEAMQSYGSIATDRFYGVSDPRLMDQLTITDTIRELGHILPHEQPSEISIHCIVHSSGDAQYGQTQLHIDYEGEKFLIRSDENGHYLVAENPVDADNPEESFVTIDPRITSDLVAKLTVPYTAPELCDFTEINSIARINEICGLLEASDFVEGSIEHTHEILDRYTVITETKKEPFVGHHIPVSFEVTEDRGSDIGPLSLSVEFADYKTAVGMIRMLAVGSEEVIMDIDHMRHFNSVIMTILKEVQPNSVSLEVYDEEYPGSL